MEIHTNLLSSFQLILRKFATTHRALCWKVVLNVLQVKLAHEAEVDVAFWAVSVAAADGSAAGVARSS